MKVSLVRTIHPSLTPARLKRMMPLPERGIPIVLAAPGIALPQFALEERLTVLIKKVRMNEGDYSLGERIDQALNLALKSHSQQIRQSGEPYIFHPLAVAEIVAGWGLGEKAVIAALLHDVSEDAGVTREEIRKEFGQSVAKMVAGVTELGKEPEYKGEKPSEADKLRKLLEFGKSDLTVILIKLADRWHNMQTLEYMGSVEKRGRKAEETMGVYVVMADLLGMWELKRTLEDLAYRHLDPENYETINARREFLRVLSEDKVRGIQQYLQDEFAAPEQERAVGVVVETRGVYELSQRMEIRSRFLEELSTWDIWRINIIVPGINDCYPMLGNIHFRYSPQGETSFNIYDPRPNGHQMLHTNVLVPDFGPLLIQIRDRSMYRAYRMGILSKDPKEWRKLTWIPILLNLLRKKGVNEKELASFMKAVSASVEVISRNGDKVKLTLDSTGLDYAWKTSPDRFLFTREILIHGRHAPLATVLRSGDAVVVVEDEVVQAKLDWVDGVTDPDAQEALRAYLKAIPSPEILRSAMRRLHRETKKHHLPVKKLIETTFAKKFFETKGFSSVDVLLQELGTGRVKAVELVREFIEYYHAKIIESAGTIREYGVRIEDVPDRVGLLNSIDGPLTGLSINLSRTYTETAMGEEGEKKAILILKIDGAAGEVGQVQFLQVSQIIENAVGGSGSIRFISAAAADKLLADQAQKKKRE